MRRRRGEWNPGPLLMISAGMLMFVFMSFLWKMNRIPVRLTNIDNALSRIEFVLEHK